MSVHLRSLRIQAGDRALVSQVSLRILPGKITVLVGASGSGKTLSARSLLGLVRGIEPGVVQADLEIQDGEKTHRPYDAPDREAAFAPIRGPLLGWLPQNPRAALDPLRAVGPQIADCLKLAGRESDPGPWLKRVNLASGVGALFPHQLSGGMAQRIGIALALARGSRFLIVDEPTTGLDPSLRAGILQELREARDAGVGLLLITHDLRLVRKLGDHLLVMDRGCIVEDRSAQDLGAMKSPQAQALWQATARLEGR
jgi:ABC-type dipeptide/oligopeptide/nickel transport system ATPase component